jgi:secreted Zn-dependent insulinase-like peptidase
MLNLYVKILKQLLVEELYPADVADLCYSIFPGDKGIVLKLRGFNQKLPVSLTKCELTFHFTTSGCEIFLNMHKMLINSS